MDFDVRELFPVKQQCLYFNFAADGPLPVTARDAIIDAVKEKSEKGMMAVPKQIAVYENLRDELATLFRSNRDNFAFTKSTSEGVLLALLAMDLKEDENYITAEDAFPTTIKMMESNCKAQMRTIRINDPKPMADQLAEISDDQTRAYVLDWAHYFTGKIIDLEAVVSLAKERNIFTVIDGIQAAGARRLDLDDSGIDFFVSGGHKWLLAPQGAGFIYVSPSVWERIPRKAFGWLGYDWRDFSDFGIRPELRDGAAVMEYGTRSYTAALGLVETLRVINGIGIDHIEAHNRGLREFFEEKILEKGYEVISNKTTTSIIPFKSKTEDILSLKKKLDKNNVVVSLRNGYIRAAFHLVTDQTEVETLIELL